MTKYVAILSFSDLKEACIPLYESLEQMCQAFLQRVKLLSPSMVSLNQHELLPQVTIYSKQLLTPATEKVKKENVEDI